MGLSVMMSDDCDPEVTSEHINDGYTEKIGKALADHKQNGQTSRTDDREVVTVKQAMQWLVAPLADFNF